MNVMEAVPGLTYEPDVLTVEQEQALLVWLDGPDAEWVGVTASVNSRRVQHYGYRYDYVRRGVFEEAREIPDVLREITPDGDAAWNQVIVNEYMSGQGISAHVDSLAYGGEIVCITLGSGATMRFTPCGSVASGESVDLYVDARSVYRMSGEARYAWKHEMIARKSDMVEGERVPRGRRVSVTWRMVPV